MSEARLKEFLKWFRDSDYHVDEFDCVVLAPDTTLKFYDWKYEIENFLACGLMDKSLKEVL